MIQSKPNGDVLLHAAERLGFVKGDIVEQQQIEKPYNIVGF